MKKHTYRARKVNDINWVQIKEKLAGRVAVLAVDVAKEKQYALLSTVDHSGRNSDTRTTRNRRGRAGGPRKPRLPGDRNDGVHRHLWRCPALSIPARGL